MDTTALKDIHDALKRLPEPSPYLAVLVADGDGMGLAIGALAAPDDHRKLSSTLAEFAGNARPIVTKHNGVLVYAGGDDVLAFLPVDKCLECARALHDDFGKRLQPYGAPTLSAGIAIGHFMENLEDLLAYGRAAEQAAKRVGGKDALAVHLYKRGGAPIEVATGWKDNPDARLAKFARLMNEGVIPTKLPYELRAMAKLYEHWPADPDEIIQLDLYRLIGKKASRGEESVRQALKNELHGMNSARLMAFAQELLVARLLARALHLASGQTESMQEAAG